MSTVGLESDLSWVAYHKFDQLFYAKYCCGRLTIKEYLDLIEISISHVISFNQANPIMWYRFRAAYYRWVRLSKLYKLRTVINNPQMRVLKSKLAQTG